MTLIRWEPRREMERAQRHFRKFFEEFEGTCHPGFSFEMGSYLPRVDVSEDEKNFYVVAELPGIKAEDVKLTVADGTLTIRGEKKRNVEQAGHNFHRIERNYGEFVRQFALPENLGEEISASFADGVLEIAIPKTEPEKPKEREIKIATGSSVAGPDAKKADGSPIVN